MILTREEKERFVLDLYNQGKSTREIAEEARMSFRDIGAILDRAEEEKETSKEQADELSQSTQAYKLFSEGKSPIQVAVALNIREPQVAKCYVEYWKLVQHHSLSRIYDEIKDDIGYFVRLYTSAKVARMGVEQVVKVLEIANNDLQIVEYRYQRLKRDLDSLEADNRNSARIFQELTDQISTIRKRLDQYELSCKEQRLELSKLQIQKIRLQELVDSFQDNNEEYAKIKKTVEEKVHSILSDQRMVLKLAVLSLVESMRNNPDKYCSLIYNNTSSYSKIPLTEYSGQYGQQEYRSPDYIDMLIEEAEKLYNKLAKELEDESISDYDCSTSSSLPLLQPPSDEKEQ